MKPINFIYQFLFIALAILTYSCSDEFDRLSINPNVSTLNAVNTPEQYNLLIQGIYSYIATPRNLGAQARGILFSRGDETSSGSDYAAFGQNSINPDYYSLKESYQYMYTVAGQSSIAIEKINDIKFTDTALRDAYLGEAYFLRAFAHYFLFTNFRQVALFKKAALLPKDYARPINTPEETWAFIEEDLQTAKKLLPKKGYWKGRDIGRVTAASAAGLLGKAYLVQSGIESKYGTPINKYNEAAKELGDIINGVYGTFSLTADYQWNFDVAHENNDESIIEFQFLGSRINTAFNPGQTTSGVAFDYRAIVFPFSNTFISSLRTRTSTVVVHNWLYNEFVNSKDNSGNTDSRMFGTLLFNDGILFPEIKRPVINGQQISVKGINGKTWDQMYPPTGGKTGMSTISSIFDPYKATNRKWIDLTLPSDEDPKSPSLWFGASFSNGVNYRYMRYAEVLLLYSEALAQGGTPTAGTADDALKVVRSRSNMPNIPATLDNIKKERILELSLEGHRFLDLLRWGEVVSVMKNRETTDPNFKKFGNGGANTNYIPFQENKNEWLPLSADDLKTNSNIKNNNPGW